MKTFRAVWGVSLVILAALTTGAGYAAKAIGLLDKKADVATVRVDEDRIGKLEVKVDELEDDSRWQTDFDMQLAERFGVHPRPVPTPRPTPSPTVTP